jgi:hypothetical protein
MHTTSISLALSLTELTVRMKVKEAKYSDYQVTEVKN